MGPWKGARGGTPFLQARGTPFLLPHCPEQAGSAPCGRSCTSFPIPVTWSLSPEGAPPAPQLSRVHPWQGHSQAHLGDHSSPESVPAGTPRPTLGGRSSPLRQFMSMRCWRRKANFQGLYMNPGLSRRRFRRCRGSSIPAGDNTVVPYLGQVWGGPPAPTQEGPHLPHGTSPSRADCPRPGPSSSGKSGRHGAGPAAPGKTKRTGPAAGGRRVTEGSPGGSSQVRPGPNPTHLLGQQGDEVPLELRLDDLHHVLDLCRLAAVNELIQGQQLLRATPALQGDPQ